MKDKLDLISIDDARLSMIEKIENGQYKNKDFAIRVLKRIEDLMVHVSAKYVIENGELHPEIDKVKNWKKPLGSSKKETLSIDERKHNFKKEAVIINDEKINLENVELQNFIQYWTEENKSKTKMKFEMQQTFQLKLRLMTWQRNTKNREQKKNFELKFNKTPSNLFVAYCSKCGNKQYPNNKWQLKDGSSCCAVEYVPEPINI